MTGRSSGAGTRGAATVACSIGARSTADVTTPQAVRYLTQLCKHFQHKRPVAQEGATGHIAFAAGDCLPRAGPGVLTLSLEAEDAPRLAQLQDVVARHLLRFAFREDMRIDWHSA